MILGIMLMLGGALHCVGERPNAEPAPVTAGAEAPPVVLAATAAAASQPEPAIAEVDAGAPPPRAPAPLHVEPWPALSALTPRVVGSLRAIAARSEREHDNVFAKLGGSSVESHAFLHCFRSDEVALGEHAHLSETIDFFSQGRAAGTSPFTRESLAAHRGWSIRQGLTGRPTRVEQELREISPRYAFALFGGNDVQARRPRTFYRHLVSLLDKLERNGVIPILGSTMPRGDSDEMEGWARRYDEVSRSIAESRHLPYMDVHARAMDLPGQGLAGDGVHPNVLLDGGRSRACDFTDTGERYGMNLRNLLAIQTLDRLRRVLTAGEPPPDADPPARRGDGTLVAPVEIERLPFAEFRTHAMPTTASLEGSSCTPDRTGPLPARLYRVIVSEPMRVRAWAFDTDGDSLVIHLLGADAQPGSCVRARDDSVFELPVGTWVFAVEAADDPEFTFSLTAE